MMRFLFGMMAMIAGFAIIYFVPPKGVNVTKYGLSAIIAVGAIFAGLIQLKILKASPNKTLKAIAAGATIRGILVILLLIVAWKVDPKNLFGNTISVMLMYFIIQFTEIPWFKYVLQNQDKTIKG